MSPGNLQRSYQSIGSGRNVMACFIWPFWAIWSFPFVPKLRTQLLKLGEFITPALLYIMSFCGTMAYIYSVIPYYHHPSYHGPCSPH
jgi:hypothetical protein